MKIDNAKLQLTMAGKILNAKTVCERANFSRGTWTRIVNGHEVKPQTVGRLAQALRVPVESLLD